AEPDDVEALFHLGALLQRRMRLEEAAEVFGQALRRAPADAQLWVHLGDVGIARFTDGSLRDAARCFEKALALQPELSIAHFGLGRVHGLEGRHDQAVRCLAQAYRLEPDSVACLAELIGEMQRVCDWPRLEELFGRLRGAIGQADEPFDPFLLLSMPSTRREQLACARAYARSISAQARGVVQSRARRGDASRKKLRLGYLSAEFHAHATAYLTAELFELHDRRRFEVAAYSYGPDDGSAMRARLRRAFDRFVDLRALSDAEAADAIRADGVDILLDLKGYTFRARPGIAALRPAPVQVSYLGYPGTMGAEFIDYLVGDRVVTPVEHAGDYTEKLVLMPDCYQVNDRRRAVAATPSRGALGLPEGFVFCCFNQSYKILPEVFSAWMRLLQAVPGSVLWLLEWNPATADNLRREADAHGIPAERLAFAPQLPLAEHLGRLAAADLFLDTCPYNAHTTASDALWAGLPVLTCSGETFASRVAGSLLHAVGLPELVTHSLPEYEALALRLARAPAELAALRGKLQRSRETAALFDTPRYVRNLEKAYEAMWATHSAGGVPRPIEL
ncbi:MAG: tetratricopeptide repeat protein, partial [Pseudomonadota bacterium]